MVRQNIAQLFDLTGKVAIVTGSAMGIGQAIAQQLAEAGPSVMVEEGLAIHHAHCIGYHEV